MSELEKFSKEWHADYRQKVINEIIRLNPKAEIKTTKYTEDLVHYTVSVVKSNIEVKKQTRAIYSSPTLEPEETANNLVKAYYLTKDDAKNAIEKVLPEAQRKFETCLAAYQDLTKNLGFSIGYQYSGDVYGIDEEYQSLEFKLEGFHFQFEVRD